MHVCRQVRCTCTCTWTCTQMGHYVAIDCLMDSKGSVILFRAMAIFCDRFGCSRPGLAAGRLTTESFSPPAFFCTRETITNMYMHGFVCIVAFLFFLLLREPSVLYTCISTYVYMIVPSQFSRLGTQVSYSFCV